MPLRIAVAGKQVTTEVAMSLGSVRSVAVCKVPGYRL
jgi:hypothetical protein